MTGDRHGPYLHADVLRRRFAGDLACPVCGGALPFRGGVPCCASCGRSFPQADPRVLDLWVEDRWDARRARWGERQHEMVEAYHELAADPDHVRRAYTHDFGPFRPWLADLAGPALDVGGGHGLIRDFLPPRLEYVSLDPSLDWLHGSWSASSEAFPSLAQPAFLIRGVGEQIPFRDGTFASVLSIWSLNHVADPGRVIQEVHRVLRAGGRFCLVLDDIPPRWRDLANGAYADPRYPSRAALLRRKAMSLITRWPIQPDHLELSERMLLRWCRGGFTMRMRRWFGIYLAYDLIRFP